MQQLLKEIEPGLLAGQVGARHANPALFTQIAKAVFSRWQIRISYFSRGTSEDTDRTNSPQRLVNYRGSWYVSAQTRRRRRGSCVCW